MIAAAFFEAVALPEQWPDALQIIADGFDCRGALLTTKDLSPSGIVSSHHMSDVLGRFHDLRWNERDFRTERANIAPAAVRDRVMRDQDIFKREEIEDSEYYRDFARPAGVGYFACAVLADDLPDFVAISLQRDQRHDFISDSDKIKLEALLPTLRRSTRLAKILHDRSIETLFDLKAEDDVIFLLLEADGKVRRGGEAAAFLPAFGLHIAYGVFRGDQARSDLAIANALEAIQAGVITDVLTTDRTGYPLAKLSFSPVVGRVRDIFSRGDVIVKIAPIDQPFRDARLAAQLALVFALTPAEHRVLLPLISGAGTDEIAQASGYTRESTRTWIKSILMKSGCTSRAAFVAFARLFERK